MPRKRRIAKGRELDELMIEDLFYGPGTCLLNGCGYLGPHGDGFWGDKSSEVQAEVLATMRADWERQWPRILQAWEDRTPHDRWINHRYYADRTEPWAQTEFGVPSNG